MSARVSAHGTSTGRLAAKPAPILGTAAPQWALERA